jgi:Mor family transcriptional regulator
MRLVTHMGGLDIHIPKRPRGKLHAELMRVMGDSTTAELMRVFGGERLYIAKDAKAAKAMHQCIIAERRAKGQPWQQIAREYTFTATFSERWVRKLGGGDTTPPSPQSGLFDIPALHHLDALSRRN